mmetsp:Transcript_26602/g.40819  ORF Transcript_26602/g.40819 Transcript_26602/m.40819 type:complete len:399 (-) Transcript_26602:122-1318(-)
MATQQSKEKRRVSILKQVVDEDDQSVVSQRSQRSQRSSSSFIFQRGSLVMKQSAQGAMTAYQQLESFLSTRNSQILTSTDDDDDSMMAELRRLEDLEAKVRRDLANLDEGAAPTDSSITPKKTDDDSDCRSGSITDMIPEIVISPDSSVRTGEELSRQNTPVPGTATRRRTNSVLGLKRQVSSSSYRKLQQSLANVFKDPESKDEDMKDDGSSIWSSGEKSRESEGSWVDRDFRNGALKSRASWRYSQTGENTEELVSLRVAEKQPQDDQIPTQIDITRKVPPTVIRKTAEFVFGRHEYAVAPLFKSGKILRTYEGSFCVALSAAAVALRVISKEAWISTQNHEMIIAALMFPLLITWLEVHLPHTVEETTIALAILLSYGMYDGVKEDYFGSIMVVE